MAETVYLKDYTPYPYRIESLHLDFDLHETATLVKAELAFECAAAPAEGPDRAAAAKSAAASAGSTPPPLFLNGENLQLKEILLDGAALPPEQYELTEEGLTLPKPPVKGVLTTLVEINPQENTQLMGLYFSDGIFCTQNEAEGFRRITFFPDRPDVMTLFTVTIRADKNRYPLLLSNGNPLEQGDLSDSRHFARWHDPYLKPCYLFALVAADLEELSGRHITASGRQVELKVFVNRGNRKKAELALASLQRAMAWDEKVFGQEYDLDLFMIVAVDSFNFGAMENKGLNIFNSALVLADPETVTDDEMITIERVVAHEFLHNRSGNRVTLRDWFQLTLKEGLTVYRDERYISSRMGTDELRIDAVKGLRQGQFSEDAGPLAHPARPAFYAAIDNFYTATVYQKGKEIIRMMQTFLGDKTFVEGIKYYFKHFDGQACCVEDLMSALEKVSGRSLAPFMKWYEQAGTPLCRFQDEFNAETGEYVLTMQQSCRPTAEKTKKDPYPIPLKLGLLNKNGENIFGTAETGAAPAALPGESCGSGRSRILLADKPQQSFTFSGLTEKPVPSLFRGFSAPVNSEYPYTIEDLFLLMEHDSDSFNRWQAAQTLMQKAIIEDSFTETARLGAAVALLLSDESLPAGLRARLLTPPDADSLARGLNGYPLADIFCRRQSFMKNMCRENENAFIGAYKILEEHHYHSDPKSAGQRHLRNVCLNWLCADGNRRDMAAIHYNKAHNMTDALAALTILSRKKDNLREQALGSFYDRWENNTLVLNKWFSLQAAAPLPDVIEDIRRLENHPKFDRLNPNRVRALYGSFTRNPLYMHTSEGYAFLAARTLEMDSINAHVSATLAKTFQILPQLDNERRKVLTKELKALSQKENLSKNLSDLLNRLLEENGK